MFLFIFSLVLFLLFIWVVFPLINKVSRVDRSIVLFLLVCSDIILVLEIVGLLGLLKYPEVIIGTQIILVGLLFLYNKVNKNIIPPLVFQFRLQRKITKSDIPIIIFASLIVFVYGFLLFLQFRFPQATSDNLYNQLSRIGHWLQQGSLDHYFAFSNVGPFYPYNNSLLMLWSVAFLRVDKLVGLVQYIGLIFLSLAIYGLGIEFGFSKKKSIWSSLFFLTYPIVAFESITGQSDILVASFVVISFYFLLKFVKANEIRFLVFSILGYALGIGTNQLAIFALPGYALLFLSALIKHKNARLRTIKIGVLVSITCTFLVGSYSYIQNMVLTGSPVDMSILSIGDRVENKGSFVSKAVINSSRLFYQFISCDGLPPGWENKCIKVKANVLGPIFRNIEKPVFLLEPEELFSLKRTYLLNEESAWYGVQSWIALIPCVVIMVVFSIRKKELEPLIILFTVIIYWFWTATIKPGWDPYVGRYLITAVALMTPFTSLLFDSRKLLLRIGVFLLLFVSFFTLSYSIMNNDSRPLVSKNQLLNLQLWGKDHSLLVQKLAYKFYPLTRHEKDIWNTDELLLRTSAWGELQPVFQKVEELIPQNAKLVVLSKYKFFPDYLLFGNKFTRYLIEITDINQLNNIQLSSFYLLSDPAFDGAEIKNLVLISKTNGWSIYIK